MTERLITIGAIASCPWCGLSPMICACKPLQPGQVRHKSFEWGRMTHKDQSLMARYLGPGWRMRPPDLIINSHHAGEYLWRWHIHTRADLPGQYLHIQTSSDPERPLHDHPWDNMSCILSGGYDEVSQMQPPHGDVQVREVRAGDTVFRRAEFAHRLILPESIPYTISLFTMGRRRREWGFWIDGTWHKYTDCLTYDASTQQTFFKYPPGTEAPAA